MRKKVLPSILLGALAAYLPLGAFAVPAQISADLSSIKMAYKVMDQTYSQENAAAYVACNAPGFTRVSVAGVETEPDKDDAISRLTRNFKYYSNVTAHSVVNSCTFQKDGAVVVCTSDTHYTLKINGKEGLVDYHNVSRDFWIKSSSGWLLKRTRDIVSQHKLNGQEVLNPAASLEASS